MTIRTKLAASISLLLVASTGLLGYGVLLVSDAFTRKDAAQRIAVIENSVQKAAQDALIQKDDLLLISYANFLKAQYPSLAYVKLAWESEGRVRALNVGQPLGQGAVSERLLQIVNPADPTRRVTAQIGIDTNVLYQVVGQERQRLQKIIVIVSLSTMLIGVLFSIWFAGTLTAPLGAVAHLAREISAGKLGGRLEWSSDDEIGALVKVFNAMSQRLEDLDETKKNFVSSVTHELRSPLGAIESFLSLIQAKLKDGSALNGDAGQVPEYLGRIQVNVQRLGGFINDLLDVAKIEKGKMECVLKPMKLQEVAADVCRFFEAKAQQQGIKIGHRIETLPQVMGDQERLRQVFVNLISNALKFTPQGGRVLLTGEQYREGDNRWVEITVSDTGRGMEARDLSRLFTAFSQGKNVSEGVVGAKGTGLGLYIVKSIVEQHGGKVNVKSAPGKGTQIAFSLKIAA